MPKRKNTSNHNRSRKDHRRPIRKPGKNAPLKFRGGDLKEIRNTIYSQKYNGIGRMAYEEKNGVQE